jgi:transcription elongation GreA/GreB family factor
MAAIRRGRRTELVWTSSARSFPFAVPVSLARIHAKMIDEVQNLVSAGKLSPADGNKLSKLQPGTFCQHKSWGVGRVASWDLLGDRLIIDFETKPGHPLKVAFAVSSLTVLPEDHFLARRCAEPETLKAMARSEPAKLVELAIKSTGGTLMLNDLDEMIKGSVVGDGEYKKWWENTKKALKPLRHILVPGKRTDPLVLREVDEDVGAGLIQAFLSARDLKGKIIALKALTADFDLIQDPANALQSLWRDLSDAARPAARYQFKETLHLLLARDELVESKNLGDLPLGSLKVSDILAESRAQLAESVSALPAGLAGRVFAAFPEAFPDGAWVTECLNQLTRTGARAVGGIAAVLQQHGQTGALAEYLKKAVRNRLLSPDLLIWICKERHGPAAGVFGLDLGHAILDALHADHLEGGPKRTGRLQDAFTDDPKLVGEMVATARDEGDVRSFAKRILSFSVFDELTRRSLMAKVIKQMPALQDMVEDSGSQREDNTLIVSWESLERRKKELEEIVNVKIPQNKKDIEIARGYGDLRENFEYKSAKQQQAVLNRMQGEYSRDIDRAQGTDFTGVSTETVGIGTIVDLEDVPDGASETFTILGAWDSDVEKNIISYLSEAAKAMIGRAVGDEVELPGDSAHDKRRARITAIRAYRS